jgi:hypothetical protein
MVAGRVHRGLGGAVALADGVSVLVAGGRDQDSGFALNTAEIWAPAR